MEKQDREFVRILLEYPQLRPRESCEEIIVERRLDMDPQEEGATLRPDRIE